MKLLAPVTKFLSRKSSFDHDQSLHLAEQAFLVSTNSLGASHRAALRPTPPPLPSLLGGGDNPVGCWQAVVFRSPVTAGGFLLIS